MLLPVNSSDAVEEILGHLALRTKELLFRKQTLHFQSPNLASNATHEYMGSGKSFLSDLEKYIVTSEQKSV